MENNEIKITLPILKGKQSSYISLKENNQLSSENIYFCEDSGNIYIGDVPAGKDIYFSYDKDINTLDCPVNSKCITPTGVYIKEENNSWKVYSNWYIDTEGIMYVRKDENSDFEPLQSSDILKSVDPSEYNALEVTEKQQLYVGAVRTKGEFILNPENSFSWDLASSPNIYMEFNQEPESSDVSISLICDISKIKSNYNVFASLILNNNQTNKNLTLSIHGLDIKWSSPLPIIETNKSYRFNIFSSIKSTQDLVWYGEWSDLDVGINFSNTAKTVDMLDKYSFVYKSLKEVNDGR